MKQFLLKTISFMLLLLLLLFAGVSWMVKYYKDNNNYMDAYEHKIEMLRDTPSPRVIFIGGSNLAFGLDSKTLEDSLGINVVNYGLSIKLGMELMLQDAIEYCRKGDIIAIAPEYELFFGQWEGDMATLSTLTFLYPTTASHFNTRLGIRSVQGIREAISQMFHSIFLADKDSDDGRYHYSSKAFNSSGDETGHWDIPPQRSGLGIPERNYVIDQSSIDNFLSLIHILENKGTTVVLLPPSVYKPYYEEYHTSIDSLSQKFAKSLHPYAVDPKEMSYDEELMFDTYYHLTKEGVDKRTPLIIATLKKLL